MLQEKHLGTCFINQNKISKFGYHDHCNQIPIFMVNKTLRKKKKKKMENTTLVLLMLLLSVH